MFHVPIVDSNVLTNGFIRLWSLLPVKCRLENKRQIHSRGITGVTFKRRIHRMLDVHALQFCNLFSWNLRHLDTQPQVLYYLRQSAFVHSDNCDRQLTYHNITPVRSLLKNFLMLLLEHCSISTYRCFVETTGRVEHVIRLERSKWSGVGQARNSIYGRRFTR